MWYVVLFNSVRSSTLSAANVELQINGSQYLSLKMNVNLSAVLLSNRTLMAFKMYRMMEAVSEKEKDVKSKFQSKISPSDKFKKI